MASSGSVNYNSTSQCFTPSSLLQDSIQLCSPYINALQTCPVAQTSPLLRSQATNLTALCMMSVWAWDDNPVYLANYTSTPPPKIQASTSCKYPDVIPILQQACAFEYSQIDIPCYSDYNMSLFAPALQYTLCQTETMLQYWRCTEQTSFDKVASCVIENADKVNWVPPIQPYNGNPTCPNPTTTLRSMGLSMLFAFLGPLATAWLLPLGWEKLKKYFKNDNPKDISSVDELGVWDREQTYTLRAHLILKSVGTDILVAYLTVLILRQSGAEAINSMKFAFIDGLFIFIIKPRAAPLTGLLGFFHGFSEGGLADVFADNVISWVAGFKIFINYWKFYNEAPANPAAPANDLKIMALGAIMSSIPAILTFLFMVGASLSIAGKQAGMAAIILTLCQVILFVMCFIGFLPILGVIELCAMAFFAIKHRKVVGKRKLSKWEKPLTTEKMFSRVFRNIIYPILVLISFVINIGNWVFWIEYLKIAGPTFCPGSSTALAALWILLPQAINLVLTGFKKLTGQ